MNAPSPDLAVPPSLPDDDDAAIAALRQLQALDHGQARPLLRAWVDSARASGRQRVQAHALCLLSRSLAMSDAAEAADSAASEALGLFETLGDAAGQAIACNAKSMLCFARGDHAGSLDLLAHALALARPLRDPGVLAGLLNSLGMTLNEVGDPQAAALAYEECLAVLPQDPRDLRHIGVRHNLAIALARWAERERDAGAEASDWQALVERAVAEAEASLADGQAAGHGPLSGQDALALALLVAGRAGQALALLERPEVLAVAQSSTLDAVQLAQTRARALVQLGRLAEAIAVCEEALSRAHAMSAELHTDQLHLTLSQAHEAAGDFQAALAAHRRFHAARARLVFERAERNARAMVPRLDLMRAQRESRVDPLTGIANRRGFEERVQARLTRLAADQQVSLMLIDVDHFKRVNDTQGHAAGDRLLCVLADVLRATCRGTEPPARLGGDEFVVLVDGSVDVAQALAQRVRDALARAIAGAPGASGEHAACSVSIGLAGASAPCTLDDLMARADGAMYEVKHRGRDGVAAAPPR